MAAPVPAAGSLRPVDGLPPPDARLPPLETAESRGTYRARAQEETEEATWYSAEEPDTLVAPSQVRLRSVHSKHATVITFRNASAYRVRALWLDFAGNEVAYSVLEPKSARRYHTYATHPWIVRELVSGTRMLLSGRPAAVGMNDETLVDIAAPPLLPWTLATHRCFPEPFKACVRGLLLAHKALEPHALATQAPASPGRLAARYGAATDSSGGGGSATKRPAPPTPPCSPAPEGWCGGAEAGAGAAAGAPCSPRASLLRLQAPLPLLGSPAKARRVGAALPPMSPRPGGCGAGCTTPRTPRSASPFSGAAGAAAATTMTTSISISSEASHVMATLTVSSPARAPRAQQLLKQTLAIEVQTCSTAGGIVASLPAGGGDAMRLDDQQQPAAAASCGASSPVCGRPSGCKKPKSGKLLFNNLLHSVKTALTPSPRPSSRGSRRRASLAGAGTSASAAAQLLEASPAAASAAAAAQASMGAAAAMAATSSAVTTITWQLAQLHQLLQDDADMPDAPQQHGGDGSAAPAQAAPWPPRDTHLGNLPNHLLASIAHLAAPPCWQTLDQPAEGRPNLLPVLLSEPPLTPEQEAAQAAAEAIDGDNDEPPPPLV